MNNTNRYDDIINLPHPEPITRPQMAMENRAAQFSPFAALTGYDDATREEARLVDIKQELSEDQIEMIDIRLAVIGQHIKEEPNVSVTCFQPDTRKAGGRYVTVSGNVRKLDGAERVMAMADGARIPLGDVRYIEGRLFDAYEQY